MSEDTFDEEVGFSFGGGEQSAEDLYKDSSYVSKNGKYHLLVKDASLENIGDHTKCAHIKLRLEVLAGTEADQVGNVLFHRIMLEQWKDSDNHDEGKVKLSDSSYNSMIRVLIALDAIEHSINQEGNLVIGEFDVNNEFAKLMVGQSMIAEVRMSKAREFKGKTYDSQPEIPFGKAWPTTHDAVADVPKDPEHAMPPESVAAEGEDL